MTSKRIGLGALCIAAIATLVLVTSNLSVSAQTSGTSKQGATTTPKAKEVTIDGRVVDLQCFMTGQAPSADVKKCAADCIRAGVPAGLETSDGLIVLGMGIKGPAKTLLPFAQQNVEVRGKLFKNGGVRYLDISSIQASDDADDEEDDETADDED
jgi:hypothetical protein